MPWTSVPGLGYDSGRWPGRSGGNLLVPDADAAVCSAVSSALRFSSKAMLTFVRRLVGRCCSYYWAIFAARQTIIGRRCRCSNPDISFGLAGSAHRYHVPDPVRSLHLGHVGRRSSTWRLRGWASTPQWHPGIFMVMVCGGGILPLIQGGVADLVQVTMARATGWSVAGPGLHALTTRWSAAKNVNKDIPVEE